MKDRELMEIPLDDRDAELLPPLHEYLKSYWPGTRREPGAQFKRFIVNTPIAEGVVFRPAAAAEPQGLWCGRCGAMQVSSRAHIRWGTLTPTMDVSQIAVRAQYPSFIPDYPLAPEASIPVTTPRTGGHLSSAVRLGPG
jgi:hypothetical protein